MFGFFISAACVAGLAFAATHGHRHHSLCGHAFGGRGFRRHRFGRQAVLYAMMSRLKATPSQEKVIRESINEFAQRARLAASALI